MNSLTTYTDGQLSIDWEAHESSNDHTKRNIPQALKTPAYHTYYSKNTPAIKRLSILITDKKQQIDQLQSTTIPWDDCKKGLTVDDCNSNNLFI